MSVLRCSRCSGLIDTDEDPDTFEPEIDEWICHPCRDRHVKEMHGQYVAERAAAEGARDIVDAGRGALLPEAWEE